MQTVTMQCHVVRVTAKQNVFPLYTCKQNSLKNEDLSARETDGKQRSVNEEVTVAHKVPGMCVVHLVANL
ncbi:hypothetical protein NDU88_010326 [Pleurodeles waltl]|uniref:Uncharacterized protein n=1 Tax=Pleurodeles waltl TaxID=8319 RepID=A0AAV7RYQ8_PLEWA|nr:hypothetical protein NDU88_010326 [Pleurodeles waltl]